jgi:hypothetical protein
MSTVEYDPDYPDILCSDLWDIRDTFRVTFISTLLRTKRHRTGISGLCRHHIHYIVSITYISLG